MHNLYVEAEYVSQNVVH